MTQQRRGSIVGAILGVVLVAVMIGQLVFAFSHVSASVHRLRLQNDAEQARSAGAPALGAAR
jgi:hypothetical protein